jgi:hypothetical protein
MRLDTLARRPILDSLGRKLRPVAVAPLSSNRPAGTAMTPRASRLRGAEISRLSRVNSSMMFSRRSFRAAASSMKSSYSGKKTGELKMLASLFLGEGATKVTVLCHAVPMAAI